MELITEQLKIYATCMLTIDDDPVLVRLELQLHDVAACRGTHETRAHRFLFLVQTADIAGILIMIYDILMVGPRKNCSYTLW